MNKQELITYLDTFLCHDQYSSDSSANGLQIDTQKKDIKKIWYAVDVTTYIIDKAIEAEVDMLLTHHGMFRGYEKTMTGIDYQRVKKCMDHGIAVYSSHLPLDAHNEVGNNIWLIKAWERIFGLPDVTIKPFGNYKWTNVGYVLHSPTPIPVAGILMPYCEHMQLTKQFFNFWNKENISSVAIVSGSSGDCVMEAVEKNIDLFITWEMVHHQITLAKELGQSIVLWWHYETEKIWPKLLSHHLQKTFPELQCVYLDEKY